MVPGAVTATPKGDVVEFDQGTGTRAPTRIRSCWLVLLAWSWLGLATGCSTRPDSEPPLQQQSAEKYYQIALGSFHNRMVSDAKIQLRRVFEVDPGHADAHYLHGLILLDEGRRMLEAMDLAACVEDEAAVAAKVRANDLHRRAYEEFRAASQGAGERAAGRGRAFNSMAAISIHLELHERAAQEAREALAADFYGERYSAYANLGWALFSSGRPIEAITELRQALLLNPEFCVARYRLARVYLERDMLPAAHEELERVLADARCPIQDAQRLRGVLDSRFGRTEDAIASWHKCVELAPSSCLAKECQSLAEMAESARLPANP